MLCDAKVPSGELLRPGSKTGEICQKGVEECLPNGDVSPRGLSCFNPEI